MWIVQTTEDGVARWLKLYGLFSFVLFLAPVVVGAESFAEFKQTQASSFKKFQNEQDNEFAKYLKTQWRGYEAYRSAPLFREPKPKYVPTTTPIAIKNIGPRVSIALPRKKKGNVTKPTQPFIQKNTIINFYGVNVGFDIGENMKKARFYPTDQNGVIEMFNALASSDATSVTEQVQAVQKQLNLNDWGVAQLLKKLAKKVYLHKDEQVLFRWFFLSKLGYDVKVGTLGSHVALLQKTKQTIFSTPRYKLDGSYYYAIDYVNGANPGEVFTYEKHYPGADKVLDFSLSQSPKFPYEPVVKELHFTNAHERYTFTIHPNQNLLDFMHSYPQVDYAIYFNAVIDPKLYRELATQIRAKINGKKAAYSLNFVLHFVQSAFEYQRDQDQFGKEKVMFAEETLSYAKSDCEDRAVLFAKLVKKLFGYGVVGVKYADHMSTALAIPIHGDSVRFGRRKYVIADPTYLHANIGKAMPKYRGMKPEKFIRISN